MFKLLLLTSLVFTPFAKADSIKWVESKNLIASEVIGCQNLIAYTKQYTQEHNAEVESGATSTDISFSIWPMELNQDGKTDYFLMVNSGAFCGSGGCTADLFVSKENGCDHYRSPSLDFETKIGVTGHSVLFPHRFEKKQCNVWKLNTTKHELQHVNSKICKGE